MNQVKRDLNDSRDIPVYKYYCFSMVVFTREKNCRWKRRRKPFGRVYEYYIFDRLQLVPLTGESRRKKIVVLSLTRSAPTYIIRSECTGEKNSTRVRI